jgi:hypothetical protein
MPIKLMLKLSRQALYFFQSLQQPIRAPMVRAYFVPFIQVDEYGSKHAKLVVIGVRI